MGAAGAGAGALGSGVVAGWSCVSPAGSVTSQTQDLMFFLAHHVQPQFRRSRVRVPSTSAAVAAETGAMDSTGAGAGGLDPSVVAGRSTGGANGAAFLRVAVARRHEGQTRGRLSPARRRDAKGTGAGTGTDADVGACSMGG